MPKPPKPGRECAICGVDEKQPTGRDIPLVACSSCDQLHCDECGSEKHCSRCAAYNLPKKFKVLAKFDYPPDSMTGATRNGGTMADVAKPLYRWYSDHPQLVTISAMKFHGVGIHWHVTIAEKEDYYRAKEKDTWIRPWGDRTCEGRYDSQAFVNEEQIADWVRKTLTAWYRKDKLVYVKFDDHEHPARWFYKEGD